MSKVDAAIEIICPQSNQNDNDNDDDEIDRSIPESKEERVLLIQRVLLAEQHWFQNLEVANIFMKVFLKIFRLWQI